VTPRAALSEAAGVAASVVAATLAAAESGYVMVASTPTEAEKTLSVIADGDTRSWVARAFLNAFRLKLDTSPATVKVAVMAATKRASGDNGGRGGDGGGGDGDGGGGDGDGGGGDGGGGGGEGGGDGGFGGGDGGDGGDGDDGGGDGGDGGDGDGGGGDGGYGGDGDGGGGDGGGGGSGASTTSSAVRGKISKEPPAAPEKDTTPVREESTLPVSGPPTRACR